MENIFINFNYINNDICSKVIIIFVLHCVKMERECNMQEFIITATTAGLIFSQLQFIPLIR